MWNFADDGDATRTQRCVNSSICSDDQLDRNFVKSLSAAYVTYNGTITVPLNSLSMRHAFRLVLELDKNLIRTENIEVFAIYLCLIGIVWSTVFRKVMLSDPIVIIKIKRYIPTITTILPVMRCVTQISTCMHYLLQTRKPILIASS